MSHPFQIRIATIEDTPILMAFNAAFNDVHETAEAFRQRFAEASRFEMALLAELDGQPAGFACLRLLPCLCYAGLYSELTELYVDPAYRGKGAAQALIAAAEQIAQERGAPQMVILTGMDNLPARTLYGKMGFTRRDVALNKDF